jgi:hypothetical protein
MKKWKSNGNKCPACSGPVAFRSETVGCLACGLEWKY